MERLSISCGYVCTKDEKYSEVLQSRSSDDDAYGIFRFCRVRHAFVSTTCVGDTWVNGGISAAYLPYIYPIYLPEIRL